MKQPTYLIIDNHSHLGISLFWKRHGLSIMEQLVPNKFLFTTANNPLEKIIENEISSGWKKIILIGTPTSIKRGFNTIMTSSLECRSTIAFGFWPLNLQNLVIYLANSSLNLRPILQVFKSGYTIQVDIPKLQFFVPSLETRYFWNDFIIKSTQKIAKTTILIDEQNFDFTGKYTCRIAFHNESLNSLTMHPGKLTRTPLLKVYLNREINLNIKKRLTEFKDRLLWKKMIVKNETLLKTGKLVEIQANWANLSLGLPEINDTVESASFGIERKSLSMVIPAKPIQKNESILNSYPAFRPSRVLANNRETSKMYKKTTLTK